MNELAMLAVGVLAGIGYATLRIQLTATQRDLKRFSNAYQDDMRMVQNNATALRTNHQHAVAITNEHAAVISKLCEKTRTPWRATD